MTDQPRYPSAEQLDRINDHYHAALLAMSALAADRHTGRASALLRQVAERVEAELMVQAAAQPEQEGN